MTLTVGTRLGHHDVTAKIGEGSMGEVYQARDTKLDRDVALKVLPEAFTSDPGPPGAFRARGEQAFWKLRSRTARWSTCRAPQTARSGIGADLLLST